MIAGSSLAAEALALSTCEFCDATPADPFFRQLNAESNTFQSIPLLLKYLGTMKDSFGRRFTLREVSTKSLPE